MSIFLGCREEQNLLNELSQLLRLTQDDIPITHHAALIIDDSIGDVLSSGHDSGQWGSQLMRYACDEIHLQLSQSASSPAIQGDHAHGRCQEEKHSKVEREVTLEQCGDSRFPRTLAMLRDDFPALVVWSVK